MNLVPYVYGVTFRMPPTWLSRRADRVTLTVGHDFSLEEIQGIYRYDFQVHIAVDGKWLTSNHVWSFNIAPRDHSMVLAKPFFLPSGALLEVDAIPSQKVHWRSNPVYIRFFGKVSL